MTIYYDAKLKTPIYDGVVIEWIEFELNGANETLVVDWEVGDYSDGSNGKASGRLKGVMFNPFDEDPYYANGHLDEVLNFNSIYTFQWRYFNSEDFFEANANQDDELILTSISFCDGNNEVIFDVIDNCKLKKRKA